MQSELATFDVGADVVLVAVRAEVDVGRRLVDLGRRAEEAHGWMGWTSEAELGAGRMVTLSQSSASVAACLATPRS